MEAEVRKILRAVLTRPSPSGVGIGTRIRQRFSDGEIAEIELPALECWAGDARRHRLPPGIHVVNPSSYADRDDIDRGS